MNDPQQQQSKFNLEGSAADYESRNVYIASLPFTFKDEDLRNLCGGFGEMESVKIMTDNKTNRCKGYGFVLFFEEESANNAVRGLFGKSIEGSMLQVRRARKNTRGPNDAPGGVPPAVGAGGGSEQIQCGPTPTSGGRGRGTQPRAEPGQATQLLGPPMATVGYGYAPLQPMTQQWLDPAQQVYSSPNPTNVHMQQVHQVTDSTTGQQFFYVTSSQQQQQHLQQQHLQHQQQHQQHQVSQNHHIPMQPHHQQMQPQLAQHLQQHNPSVHQVYRMMPGAINQPTPMMFMPTMTPGLGLAPPVHPSTPIEQQPRSLSGSSSASQLGPSSDSTRKRRQ